MRSCSDVHNYLVEADVAHEIIHLPRHCKTAERAADLLGVSVTEVVKSLLFFLDGQATMVLVPGDRSVDTTALRAVAGCSEVQLARAAVVLELTGYPVGAVPPCGLATALPVVVDWSVFESDVVYCGGGTVTTMVKMRSRDLMALLDPQVADVSVGQG